MLRRRREQKTDYRQRLALLKSRKPRLVVRRTLSYVHAQLVRYEPDGDRTILEVSSKHLAAYGWKGHGGNLPAAYLTGMLIALKAQQQGIADAVLDIGLQRSIANSAMFACAAGARAGGLNVPLGSVPPYERLSGASIAAYAKLLKASKERYQRQFGAYLKANVDPEQLPAHFEDVKAKLLAAFGAKERRDEEESFEDGES